MTAAIAFSLVYLLPGFAAAGVFRDRTRWNPIAWVLLSSILLPVALANLGTFGLRATSSAGAAALVVGTSALLGALAWLARRRGAALAFEPLATNGTTRFASWAALGIVVLFTGLVAATRTSLIEGRGPGLNDDFQRLAQVAMVAVTGVPPRHYFTPEVPLSYYYYDTVLPGTVMRIAHPALMSGTALFAHLAIQTLAFGLVLRAIAFRLCRNASAALLLVLLLTFAGGPAFWRLPAAILSRFAPALPALSFEISLPATLAVWVPHHWVAGNCVLLGLAILAHVRGSMATRAVLLGALLAFVCGDSVFAALSLAPALLLWAGIGSFASWREWDRPSLALTFGVAALLSVVLLDTYLGKRSLIGLDRGLAPTVGAMLASKLAGLPAFALRLLYDGGGAIVLFAIWSMRERGELRRDPAKLWIAAIGVAFLPFAYLWRSPIFNDFGTRGIVPLQFAWAVGAAWALEASGRTWVHNALVAAAFVGVLSAVPPSLRQIGVDLERNASAPPLSPYVVFLDSQTSLDSPVISTNPRQHSRDWGQHLIARVRPLDHATVLKLDAWHNQYIQAERVAKLDPPPWNVRSVDGICRTGRRLRGDVKIVYVLDAASGTAGAILDAPVFEDESVKIYAVDCSTGG